MPDISGLDIARYLYHSNPDTKVVFLSAYEEFEYARQAISYGIHSYLVKPIALESLKNVLNEVYMQLCDVKRQNQFKGNNINSSIRHCFIDLLSNSNVNTEIFMDRLSKLGVHVETDSASFASISVSIQDHEDYLYREWSHGRERLVSALEQLINTEHPLAYSGLTFFYESGFDIFVISKPDVSLEQFTRFIYAYMHNIVPNFAECLHMNIQPTLQFITGSLAETIRYREEFLIKRQAVNNNSKHQIFGEVKRFIEQNYNTDITLESLAADIGFNPTYFSKLFKEYFGTNFVNYLCNTRIEAAKKLLVDTDIRVTAIFSMVGFSQHSYFVRQFKAYTGSTPIDYRNKYRKL